MFPHQIQNLINQSKISIIDKNLFNHVKVSKWNQSKVLF